MARRTPWPHKCSTLGCTNIGTIAIGKDGYVPNYRFVCDECAEKIARDLTAVLAEKPESKSQKTVDLAKAPEGIVSPEPVVVPPEQTPVATPVAENVVVGDVPDVESTTTVSSEQEYYTCKQCGQKFKKPEELNEYRNHIMKAHRKDK
jgi:predicted nucleic acid-binding Zn ribbon protein